MTCSKSTHIAQGKWHHQFTDSRPSLPFTASSLSRRCCPPCKAGAPSGFLTEDLTWFLKVSDSSTTPQAYPCQNHHHLMTTQWLLSLWECRGLHENCSHNSCVWILGPWLVALFREAVQPWGGRALLKEEHHWGQSLWVSSWSSLCFLLLSPHLSHH